MARLSKLMAEACGEVTSGGCSKLLKKGSVARLVDSIISVTRPAAPFTTAPLRLEPGRHAIERNQLVDFKAGPDQRPFRAFHQYFRH